MGRGKLARVVGYSLTALWVLTALMIVVGLTDPEGAGGFQLSFSFDGGESDAVVSALLWWPWLSLFPLSWWAWTWRDGELLLDCLAAIGLGALAVIVNSRQSPEKDLSVVVSALLTTAMIASLRVPLLWARRSRIWNDTRSGPAQPELDPRTAPPPPPPPPPPSLQAPSAPQAPLQ